mmetsp:Transcript_2002/g.6153  ORF Transcript_2002/g.6153 Transcript_2002/m.6153 type:complete len:207 (+) Transcript_2002:1399-2019(+)
MACTRASVTVVVYVYPMLNTSSTPSSLITRSPPARPSPPWLIGTIVAFGALGSTPPVLFFTFSFSFDFVVGRPAVFVFGFLEAFFANRLPPATLVTPGGGLPKAGATGGLAEAAFFCSFSLFFLSSSAFLSLSRSALLASSSSFCLCRSSLFLSSSAFFSASSSFFASSWALAMISISSACSALFLFSSAMEGSISSTRGVSTKLE